MTPAQRRRKNRQARAAYRKKVASQKGKKAHAAKCLAAWHRRAKLANELRRELYFRFRSREHRTELKLIKAGFSIIDARDVAQDTTFFRGPGAKKERELEAQANAILKDFLQKPQ